MVFVSVYVYCVVDWNVFLIESIGNHPNKGRKDSYSGLSLEVLIGLDMFVDGALVLIYGESMIQLSSYIANMTVLLSVGADVGITSQSLSDMAMVALFMHNKMLSSSSGGSNDVVSK